LFQSGLARKVLGLKTNKRLLGKVVERVPLLRSVLLHRQHGVVGMDLLPLPRPVCDGNWRDADAARAQPPPVARQPHIWWRRIAGVVQGTHLLDGEVVRRESICGRASCVAVCHGSAVEAPVFRAGGEVEARVLGFSQCGDGAAQRGRGWGLYVRKGRHGWRWSINGGASGSWLWEDAMTTRCVACHRQGSRCGHY
jgi:hypothetical protein